MKREVAKIENPETLDVLSLHVGLPKTATTALQLFLSENFENYLGPGARLYRPGFFLPYRRRFTTENPRFWATSRSLQLRARLRGRVRKVLEFTDNRSLVFSWEGALTSGMFMDDSGFGPSHTAGESMVSHLASLVQDCFPPARELRVLFTVRRQPEWLGSLYAQRSARIEGAGQTDFENEVRKLLNRGALTAPVDLLATIVMFERVWPSAKIFILPVEDFSEHYYASSLFEWLPKTVIQRPFRPDQKFNVRSVAVDRWALRPLHEARKAEGDYRVAATLGPPTSEIFLTATLKAEILRAVKASNSAASAYSPQGLPFYF